ncbi:MAG: ABC transporter ATP-binding protein [Pseudomonadota bacterium]
MSAPGLSMRGLTCDFGPFRAVDDVTLEIKTGSITGLIGPNGAGKSTLFNALTGVLAPTSGSVHFRGRDITRNTPDQRFAQGLVRTFQIPRPFPRMSVLENVMLAPLAQLGERLWGPVLSPRAVRQQEAEIRDRALGVLEFTNLRVLADQAAGEISGGQRKLLELARVLMADPSVILLDEPAAGVNPSLTAVLLEKIQDLNRQGKTFLIIEHDMDFVMRHCEPVVALAQGRVVFEGTAAAAQADPHLLEAYLGGMAHG